MTSELVPSAAAPVRALIEAFRRLPSIGPKSAQRLTYHLIRTPREEAEGLAAAIIALKDHISLCKRCFNIAESDLCSICDSDSRDQTRICVVEEPLDVLAIERSRAFSGLYHVLHGVISPMNNIGPEQLKITELLDRFRDNAIVEIVVATNPNLEGEATAMYLQRLCEPLGIQVTRLARGLPSGADLEYSDETTLAHALRARFQMPAISDQRSPDNDGQGANPNN